MTALGSTTGCWLTTVEIHILSESLCCENNALEKHTEHRYLPGTEVPYSTVQPGVVHILSLANEEQGLHTACQLHPSKASSIRRATLGADVAAIVSHGAATGTHGSVLFQSRSNLHKFQLSASIPVGFLSSCLLSFGIPMRPAAST